METIMKEYSNHTRSVLFIYITKVIGKYVNCKGTIDTNLSSSSLDRQIDRYTPITFQVLQRRSTQRRNSLTMSLWFAVISHVNIKLKRFFLFTLHAFIPKITKLYCKCGCLKTLEAFQKNSYYSTWEFILYKDRQFGVSCQFEGR